MKKNNLERKLVRGDAGTEVSGLGNATKPLPTTDTVEKRARELAGIGGHSPNQVSGSDRVQAKKELLGSESADVPADDAGIVPSGMGAPPTSYGKQAKKFLPEDDEVEARTVQQ